MAHTLFFPSQPLCMGPGSTVSDWVDGRQVSIADDKAGRMCVVCDKHTTGQEKIT